MDKKITDILDYKSSKVEVDKIKVNEVLNKELLKFQFEEDYLKEGDLSIENASVITFHSCIIENYTDTRTIKESNRPNHSGINQKRKNVSEFNVWDYELSFSREFQNSTDSHEILDSHHALGCSTCRQQGTLRCSNCNGGGEVICSSCSGRGEKKCSNCNGRVNIKCWSCSGKGIIEKGYGENKETERCSRCYGQGSKKCSRCSNGYITCSNCSGRGKVTCRSCEGTGEVTCYNCEGYGTMDHYYIVSANFINLSQRLILTTPYSGFNYDKAKSNNFNIRNKLFEIQKTKFEEKHFDEIKSSSFYSQITSFFDFKDNESTRLITSRISVFENKYFEVTFSFYGEKHKIFLDKNFENSYYDGKKPSEQYELDLLKKSIESSVKNELASTKKTIHKLSKYDFIDISEKEIINAIEDTQNIYKAFSEYKSKKYSSAERVLKLVSIKKTKEYDFKLLRKKLNHVYNMNTIIFWIISILPLYYFLYNTSINYIIRNTLFTIIILIFSILINKYLKNILLSRFLVVLLIIVQFIFINIIHTPESRILACDCWEQSVDKSGMAYDNMTSKQQIFREKCFDIFKNETSMKNACEYFPVENLQNKKKNNEEK